MRPSWLNRHWLKLWLALLALLLLAAPLKRHFELKRLSGRIVAKLQYKAEHGYPAPYTGWGDLQGYLWDVNDGGAQGPAIYLINRGYTDPALLRVLLLSEAQRPYDWAYTYPRVRNYDLRSGLIRRCLAAYPDDLKVAWAAGVLELAAGDTEQAQLQLMRLLPLGPRATLDALARDQGVEREHILGRILAAQTLQGRNYAAGACAQDWYNGRWVKRKADDPVAAKLYANWLAESGMYSELLALLAPESPASKLLSRDDSRHFRALALFWSGDLEAYRQIKPADPASIDAEHQLLLRTEALSPTGPPGVQQLRACGDIYAATRDEHWLKLLQDYWERAGPVQVVPDLDAPYEQWEAYSEVRGASFDAGTQLARAYVLAGRWQDAQPVLDSVIAATSENCADDPAFLTQLFLCRLALGVPLGKPVVEREIPDWAKNDRYYVHGEWVNGEWVPEGEQPAGPFAALRGGDRLTALMRSPQFAEALKASGRTLEQVLPELRAATKPERDTYYDYSNGELRKGVL